MTYTISECGFKSDKVYDSLPSAMRVAAKMVASNQASTAPGQGSYIYIRDDAGRTVVEVHAPSQR